MAGDNQLDNGQKNVGLEFVSTENKIIILSSWIQPLVL